VRHSLPLLESGCLTPQLESNRLLRGTPLQTEFLQPPSTAQAFQLPSELSLKHFTLPLGKNEELRFTAIGKSDKN